MNAAVEINGYVEATTPTQVLGWAWAPGAPGRRVKIQALLGESVIAEAAADREREDLARNGIGDGRHAFELQLPEAVQGRLRELRVIARTDDGATVSLSVPPAADATLERLEHLQRGIDALVASQRVLHRNLQAALLAQPNREPSELSALQEQLKNQVATIELFAMRLDEQYVAPAVAAPPSHSRMVRAAFAVAMTALAIAVYGLWRELAV